MKLTSKTIEAIKDSPTAQAAIAVALKVKMSSVARYLRVNDGELTKLDALTAISETLGLTIDEMVEKATA